MGDRARRSRRDWLRGGLFLAALGPLAGCGMPSPRRQPDRVPRVGYLGIGGTGPPNSLLLEAFRRGLRDLGYVEGQTIVIEYRFLDGRMEQAPALAAELVGLKVDLIVTAGGEATVAAKGATATVPIVGAILGGDPVGQGLVASLARPGGNVTGVGASPGGITVKGLELLTEVVPGLTRVAVLGNANNAIKVAEFREIREAAPSFGLHVLPVEVRRDEDLDGAFQAIASSGAEALKVLQDPLTAANSVRIAAFAVQQRLPAVYGVRLAVDAGGLMSHGPHSTERYYRAAVYVDKILKGARPADLPVELPNTFELVVNLKAAEAIGLAVPPAVLQRATDVIR